MRGARSPVSVVSLNYDRSLRKNWAAELIRFEPPLIELAGVFERDISHPALGHIVNGTLTKEYFWVDRWYNVFRFEEPWGDLKYFYCNMAMPPTYAKNRLEFVDLEIDLVVRPDWNYEILDEDDFEASVKEHRYPGELIKRVQSTLEELLGLLERRDFPFV